MKKKRLIISTAIAISILSGMHPNVLNFKSYEIIDVAASEETHLEGTVAAIEEYGNIVLDGITGEDLRQAGYEYGDMVEVTIGNSVNEMPYCTNYPDVDVDCLILREQTDDGNLTVAINMGDYASTYGIAEKVTDDEHNVSWILADDSEISDIKVSVELKEKGTYREEMLIHQLERTDERDDYSSDEIFANFRAVSCGSIGENTLFRSSSPVDNQFNRAAYADKFVESNSIKTVLNLANTAQMVEDFFEDEDYASPNYRLLYEGGYVLCLNLSVDLKSDDFKAGLVEGLRFINENEGPYLIHCTEGKDRTGYVCALLEALMGAEYYDIIDDYMTTYINYYHVETGTEKYEAIKNSNIDNMLEYLTDESDPSTLSGEQFAECAAEYLISGGMTEEEIDLLKTKLSTDYK